MECISNAASIQRYRYFTKLSLLLSYHNYYTIDASRMPYVCLLQMMVNFPYVSFQDLVSMLSAESVSCMLQHPDSSAMTEFCKRKKKYTCHLNSLIFIFFYLECTLNSNVLALFLPAIPVCVPNTICRCRRIPIVSRFLMFFPFVNSSHAPVSGCLGHKACY